MRWRLSSRTLNASRQRYTSSPLFPALQHLQSGDGLCKQVCCDANRTRSRRRPGLDQSCCSPGRPKVIPCSRALQDQRHPSRGILVSLPLPAARQQAHSRSIPEFITAQEEEFLLRKVSHIVEADQALMNVARGKSPAEMEDCRVRQAVSYEICGEVAADNCSLQYWGGLLHLHCYSGLTSCRRDHVLWRATIA